MTPTLLGAGSRDIAASSVQQHSGTAAAAAPVPGSALPSPAPRSAAAGGMEAALDTRCPICLDSWDSVAYTLPCHHQFCFRCIRRWTSSKAECPLCKQGVRSIVHSVQADDDFQELLLSPDTAAPVATQRAPGPRALWPWAAGTMPRAPPGGLSLDTWAVLFREHPALLRPLRPWLRRELGRMLGAEDPQVFVLTHSTIWALLLYGLEEDTLGELLEPDLEEHTTAFVRRFLTFAVHSCSRRARRLLGLHIPPAAGPQEANPVPQPAPAAQRQEVAAPSPAPSGSPAGSSRDEAPRSTAEPLRGRPAAVTAPQAAPAQQPAQPEAGPSGTSTPGGTRRAPKRSGGGSQHQEPPNKRPPGRQP